MALPEKIYAHASPRSITGAALLSTSMSRLPHSSIRAFRASPLMVSSARARLEQAGFEVLQTTPLTINFAGPADLFEKRFRTKLVEKELTLPSGLSTTFLDSPDTERLGHVSTVGTPFSTMLEGIALETPRSYFAASAVPPPVDYHHLNVPEGVAEKMNASLCHAYGVTGAGIRVAFVDSGWYRHPHFVSHGYHVAPTTLAPGATNPDTDESGHGTGESANVLAVAPGCQLLPIKMNFVNSIAAFNLAISMKPDVISCSWGSHSPFALSAADLALAGSVAEAVASGIVVVFSAGNGHAGFPGQHPDVISAGGTFLDEGEAMQASNYASGFASQIYPGRIVPDVCGLVGMRPRAAYIMLPVEPGDAIDADSSGGVFPDGDMTAPDDGWAAFSGTSAAAPQLAGICALIRQAAPGLSPALVKLALTATGRDVAAGFCSPVGQLHNGLPAAPGPDEATGHGLADAFLAVVAGYVLGQYAGGMAFSSAQKAGPMDTGFYVY